MGKERDRGYSRSELGEWQEPSIRTEDNRKFIKRLAPKSVKLIVTSPPYNIGKTYESDRSMEAYLEGQKALLELCLDVLHPNGSVCWQVGNHVVNEHIEPLDALLYPIFRENGLVLRNRIIWHFGHGLHCTKRLSGRYETINWWTRPGEYTWHLDPIRIPSKYPGKRHFKGPNAGKLSGNPLGKNPSDYWPCDLGNEVHNPVWEIPNVKHNHVEKTIHPCQFPVELVERLVLALTDPADTVFDPFMGVGSTVIAAAKQHRVGIGCDTDSEYVRIARDRVRVLRDGYLPTRPIGKPVYDPAQPNGGHGT